MSLVRLARTSAAAATLAFLATSVADAQEPAAPLARTRAAQPAKLHASRGPQIVRYRRAGHYVITVRKGSDPRAVAKRVAAKPDHVFRTLVNGFSARLDSKQLRKLRKDRKVTRVEQDTYGGTDGVQTVGSGLWGLDRIDQRSGLSGGYLYNATGAGVRVYVIDTGIDVSNPEFGGRAQNVYDAFGGDGSDCKGHGTHVAGTIGSATYGVAKGVLIRGVKVMGCDGHYVVPDLLAALEWVRKNAIKPAVVNMSLGGSRSATVNTATRALADSGVFVSVSAGNDGIDACTQSPASASGTFTAGASDNTDTRWASSNYGQCVDAYAPGVGIVSTLPGNRTAAYQGTSMAAPHITGIVALATQKFGTRDWGTWVQWLKDNATVNAIRSNPTGTPNRLVWKGDL